MKAIFWICTIITMIEEYYVLRGFVNVYFKNYNGGRHSSSSSIVYVCIAGLAILGSGLFFYFTDHFKIATAIVGVPVILLCLYLFLILILPFLTGSRMN